jgi:glycosyltransferase involved in cell wall biosynthesis
MQDKISVIIPVYNVEKYVAKCIESVIKQSYKNLEIIIINDGSTDSSGEICNKYLEFDNRIIVKNQENQGLSMARNNGLGIASGEYIAFVDSDDYIDYDMFELLHTNLCIYEADISMCNIYRINKNGKTIIDKSGKEIFHHYNLQSSTNILLENDKKIIYLGDSDNNYVWNKLYKKSLFSQIYFPRNRMYEDVFITYKLFEKANKIIISPEYKYYYVQHQNSIVNQEFKTNHLDIIDAYIERYNYLSIKYPDSEPLFRKYIFIGLLNCLNYASKNVLSNEIILTIENVISIIKKYDFTKCGLSEGQENLLKIAFIDLKKFISIAKFYHRMNATVSYLYADLKQYECPEYSLYQI